MNRYLVKHFFYPIHERIKGNNTLNILRSLEISQKFSRSEIENIQILYTTGGSTGEPLKFYI